MGTALINSSFQQITIGRSKLTLHEYIVIKIISWNVVGHTVWFRKTFSV